MPYVALTPELTQDYDERTSLTTYRMAFSIIGSLVAFIVPLLIIGTMRPENSGRVFTMGIIFGAICALPLLLTFFGTREKPEYYTQSPAEPARVASSGMEEPALPVRGRYFPLHLDRGRHHPGLPALLPEIPHEPGSPKRHHPGSDIHHRLAGPAVLEWASRKTDKRKAYVAGMIFLSAIMVALIFLSPSAGLPLVLVMAVLAGIGVSAIHVLTWAIIPDAVEVDELATGQRHEGIFYSLVSLFKKVASSIAIPLTLLVLDWSGYVSNAATQKPSTILAIRILIGPVPSVLLLGGIIFALFYPLSRAGHAQARAEIAARTRRQANQINPK